MLSGSAPNLTTSPLKIRFAEPLEVLCWYGNCGKVAVQNNDKKLVEHDTGNHGGTELQPARWRRLMCHGSASGEA